MNGVISASVVNVMALSLREGDGVRRRLLSLLLGRFSAIQDRGVSIWRFRALEVGEQKLCVLWLRPLLGVCGRRKGDGRPSVLDSKRCEKSLSSSGLGVADRGAIFSLSLDMAISSGSMSEGSIGVRVRGGADLIGSITMMGAPREGASSTLSSPALRGEGKIRRQAARPFFSSSSSIGL